MDRYAIEALALRAGLRVPSVMPLKKKAGEVCHTLNFACPTGRKRIELALDATEEQVKAAIAEAVAQVG